MSYTLFEKLWNAHLVHQEKDAPSLLYIDGHIIHEVTSPQAFDGLRKRKLPVRRPNKTLATADHNVPTQGQKTIRDIFSKHQVDTLVKNCKEFGITLYGLDSDYQGIVHVIGPELGFTQPGMTIVCGDSHTSTHGALGTLSWGIGTSEVEMVLATQCILIKKPKTMRITINGKLQKGISAKDIILSIIRKIGVNGATGYAVEYAGSVIKNISIEERMTICNMTIEAGGRMGMIGVDDKTISYLKGRKFSPKGKKWKESVKKWKTYVSDSNAVFDKEITISSSKITPLVTYGTNPSMSISFSETIPHPKDIKDATKRKDLVSALSYMNLSPGMKLSDFPIDMVFIGSCTNSRLTDLQAAASVIKGKKVDPHIKAMVVPGSRSVKRAAEKQGLDRIFKEAGFEWRWAGCSACLGMNDDKIPPGKYCVSTSNRNFEGRQGPGARTFLASPITAALAALYGRLVDPRNYL